MLSLSNWAIEDPLANAVVPSVDSSNKLFLENSKVAPMFISNDVIANYKASLEDVRTIIIADIVTGGLPVEEGMKSYHEQTDAMVEEMLASLTK